MSNTEYSKLLMTNDQESSGPFVQEMQAETVLFDKVFSIDIQRDLADIQSFMRRIKRNPRFGRLASQWDYKSYQERDELKYSDEQIQAQQWEAEDLDLVIEELRKDRIDRYFGDVARKYEPVQSIPDSIVRLDQEEAIFDDLNNGKPVLIRGNWRLGKTSMLYSLRTHRYGDSNMLFIDAMGEAISDKVDIDDFKNQFGLYKVVRFIVKREFPEKDFTVQLEEEAKLKNKIAQSGKTPFEYLDSYLQAKNETVFLGLDEVIGYAELPARLHYLAELRKLKNIKLAIVLHRFHRFEEELENIFDDYSTHFIRALSVDEVKALVEQPLLGTDVTFTDDAIEEIIAFTGGRPMEINNLCRALLDPFSKHKKQKFVYKAEDIKEVTSKESWRLSEAFQVAIATYKKIYQRSLSQAEIDIVNVLVTNPNGVAISELSAELVQPLVDTTYVVKDELLGVYRINGELFRKVVQELNS